MNKKEQIIKAIEEMDVSMLEVLLDENKTYGEATKKAYLKKLEKVFREFREEGDTELISYEGACKHKVCPMGGSGGNGFLFVGNHSKSYFGLMFEETENDYENINSCMSFQTYEDVSLGNYYWFPATGEDEKPGFKPDETLKYFIRKSHKAVEELNSHFVMKNETFRKWQDKYYWLHTSISEFRGGNGNRWSPNFIVSVFDQCYSDLMFFYSKNEEREALARVAVDNFDFYRELEADSDWIRLVQKYPDQPLNIFGKLVEEVVNNPMFSNNLSDNEGNAYFFHKKLNRQLSLKDFLWQERFKSLYEGQYIDIEEHLPLLKNVL